MSVNTNPATAHQRAAAARRPRRKLRLVVVRSVDDELRVEVIRSPDQLPFNGVPRGFTAHRQVGGSLSAACQRGACADRAKLWNAASLERVTGRTPMKPFAFAGLFAVPFSGLPFQLRIAKANVHRPSGVVQ